MYYIEPPHEVINKFLHDVVTSKYQYVIDNSKKIDALDSSCWNEISQLTAHSMTAVEEAYHIEDIRSKSDYCKHAIEVRADYVGQWHWPRSDRDVMYQSLDKIIEKLGVNDMILPIFGGQSIYIDWGSLREIKKEIENIK